MKAPSWLSQLSQSDAEELVCPLEDQCLHHSWNSRQANQQFSVHHKIYEQLLQQITKLCSTMKNKGKIYNVHLIEVITTKMCISRCRKHLKHTITNFKNCDRNMIRNMKRESLTSYILQMKLGTKTTIDLKRNFQKHKLQPWMEAIYIWVPYQK